MSEPVFLTLDEVFALHEWQIDSYGGARGLRDAHMLESAIATPHATFDGRYLHATLHEMAAAYLFHLAQDHPFVDGNKRVALAAALVFLWVNGFKTRATEDEIVELTIGVASGRVTKSEVAVFFKAHSVKR